MVVGVSAEEMSDAMAVGDPASSDTASAEDATTDVTDFQDLRIMETR